jgi:hypothetical protein
MQDETVQHMPLYNCGVNSSCRQQYCRGRAQEVTQCWCRVDICTYQNPTIFSVECMLCINEAIKLFTGWRITYVLFCCRNTAGLARDFQFLCELYLEMIKKIKIRAPCGAEFQALACESNNKPTTKKQVYKIFFLHV